MTLQSQLYPKSRYRGHFTPENLLFDANLQEFAQRVGYISNLSANGKLSPEESYSQLEVLWQQLERIHQSNQASSG